CSTSAAGRAVSQLPSPSRASRASGASTPRRRCSPSLVRSSRRASASRRGGPSNSRSAPRGSAGSSLGSACDSWRRPPACGGGAVLGGGGRVAGVRFGTEHLERYWLNRYFPTIAKIDLERFPSREALGAELYAAGLPDVRVVELSQRGALTRETALERIHGR